ncbi:DENN domain-containing protein 1A isoform X2 [Phlebotomus papatasi]|uniref:DENN domain-containing protein 1A isoform X2 n=1 Tax=Phlebotomus papatasi TaxID=29031 RepID=UPI0024836A86|nr:DENN domain-containing protein 1A isoform X2 [Phlebotomus papatasi]
MSTRLRQDVKSLFEFWCEIAPQWNNNKEKTSNCARIIECYPEAALDDKILNDITQFVFPYQIKSTSNHVQIYSFVLTNADSKWSFGFCRHEPDSEVATVIFSYLPWHDVFLRLINVCVELKRHNSAEFRRFLQDIHSNGIPEPGSTVNFSYGKGSSVFILRTPTLFSLPSIPENHNLNMYYNFVHPDSMIEIFAAMLTERRIIFMSRHLDVLTSCVQAAKNFIYPMIWQHLFIPILPLKLKDFLMAPMPYLIGVSEAIWKWIRQDELGEVVIYNCDTKVFIATYNDVKSLPHELVSGLRKKLEKKNLRGDDLSKAFLGVIVQLIGSYRDAVKFSQSTQGRKIIWDGDAFIESRPVTLRPFLKKMLQLQIFQQFIEDKLEALNTGLGYSDEFELETLRYAEKSTNKAQQYKEFLKNVKDKVKGGGKGVKNVYQNIKTKYQMTYPSNFYQHKTHNSTESVDFSPYETLSLSPGSRSQSNAFSPSLTRSDSDYCNRNKTSNTSSSASSSDMNLLQELQDHAFFKASASRRESSSTDLLHLNDDETVSDRRNHKSSNNDLDFLLSTNDTAVAETSSSVTGFTNPLYPYFIPKSSDTSKQASPTHKTEELELLRQYGLDKFS